MSHSAPLNSLLGESIGGLQHSTFCCWGGVSCNCRVVSVLSPAGMQWEGGCRLSLTCASILHGCTNQQEMLDTCFDSNSWPSLNLNCFHLVHSILMIMLKSSSFFFLILVIYLICFVWFDFWFIFAMQWQWLIFILDQLRIELGLGIHMDAFPAGICCLQVLSAAMNQDIVANLMSGCGQQILAKT